jgi:hypothetical protein
MTINLKTRRGSFVLKVYVKTRNLDGVSVEEGEEESGT